MAVHIVDNASPQAFRVMKSGLKFWTDLAMLSIMTAGDNISMVWSSKEFRERCEEFLEKRKIKPRKFYGTLP